MNDFGPSRNDPKIALCTRLFLTALAFVFWTNTGLAQNQSIYVIETLEPRSSTRATQASSESGHAQLAAIGGYQPGKVPVVFVHGLESDAATWEETIAQIRLDPALDKAFQFWTFEYSTDISYLYSASQLRSAWRSALVAFDPYHTDHALANAVFVGHSMGGLLARLQVTNSKRELWNCMREDVIEHLKADPSIFSSMREALEFSAQSTVRRVVYIGTPHRGSLVTKSFVGRIANRMSQVPDQVQANFNALRESGVGSVPGRAPTAIDQLAPGDPVLATVASLPISSGVSTHSIIGTGYRTPPCTIGDRIVSVESARTPGIETELLIKAKHTTIHRNPKTIAELKRILREHAQLMTQAFLQSQK